MWIILVVTLASSGAGVKHEQVDQPAEEQLWLSVFPEHPVVRSLSDLQLLVRAFNAHGSENEVQSSEWEIRDLEQTRRIALLAVDWPWPKSPEKLPTDDKKTSGFGERSAKVAVSDEAIRETGRLEPAEYLLAWNVNGQRRSNVICFQVNPDHDLKSLEEGERPLRIETVEPPPGHDLPLLGIRLLWTGNAATGQKPGDAPHFSQVAYPTLIINGTRHQWEMYVWAGPDRALEAEEQATYLLDLRNLQPPVRAGDANTVVAEVKSQQSDSIALAIEGTMQRTWDDATAKLAPAPKAQVSLTGTVIAPDGKPAIDYEVYIEHEDWRNRLGGLPHVGTDKQGRYLFKNLPAGRYGVWTNPSGKGQPMLRCEDVLLQDDRTLQLDLDLTSRFTISGGVADVQGQPIPNREVMSTWTTADGNLQYQDFAVTDAQGQYQIGSPLPAASYVGLSGTGRQPAPHHNVEAPKKGIDFVVDR